MSNRGPVPKRLAGGRIVQACTRCRAGKIRCDGGTPTCSACAERGRDCVYPETQRTRGPGKSKQRIEALEERLARMESMLRQEQTATDPGPSLPESSRLSLPDHASHFLRISERMAGFREAEVSAPLRRPVLSVVSPEASELLLIEQALESVTAELPFFQISWFLGEMKHPDALSRADAPWQAMLNSLVASSVVYRTAANAFHEVNPCTWAFLRNAYAVLPELILQGHSLEAPQAVMAMVMFTRLSADARTTSLLLSMAIRMQHALGPHDLLNSSEWVPTTEDENRDRLFWTSYVLDMETSANTGLPPTHALLSPLPIIPSHIQDDTTFRLRIELAAIQSRISKEYIITHEAEHIALLSELEAWARRVPAEIRPAPDGDAIENTEDDAVDFPATILQLVYYNCVTMVCWSLVRRVAAETTGYLQKTGIVQDRADEHRRKARSSARATIHCLGRFRFQNFPELWRALCYPLSATIALLAVVCKEPTHPEAEGDLAVIDSFVRFLEKMAHEEGCDLERMIDGVNKFRNLARDAVGAAKASIMPVNPALWPLNVASGCTAKAIATSLTCEVYHPMYIAQSFMGNMPNRDTVEAKRLAEKVVISWGENGYGPFVPDSLMPATYGFVFSS
ncbi:activator of stress genes 1 [Echria macrotheca]|uniref:Activator of stress genes 1 n=1 Tax=Echria macrotheca TaxID=438768 RepID=A0AAJ0B468_9PEZI|nr:activator of stress genes 1 [Echria macrotheca]